MLADILTKEKKMSKRFLPYPLQTQQSIKYMIRKEMTTQTTVYSVKLFCSTVQPNKHLTIQFILCLGIFLFVHFCFHWIFFSEEELQSVIFLANFYLMPPKIYGPGESTVCGITTALFTNKFIQVEKYVGEIYKHV